MTGLRVKAAALLCGSVLLGIPTSLFAGNSGFLWEIGKRDGSNAEFALAPGNYNQFKEDAVYLVGESDSKRDWPYVQPGPDDSWAGRRQHTFAILFGLKQAPTEGDCRLSIDLLDTHAGNPPALRVLVNGRLFDQTLPRGGGDESVSGQVQKGKPVKFTVTFPAKLLNQGDNQICITSATGSWILYDWVGLETPAGLEIAKAQRTTLIENVVAIRALREVNGKMCQPVRFQMRNLGAEANGTIQPQGAETQAFHLQPGTQWVDLLVPAVETEQETQVGLDISGQTIRARVMLRPVKKLTVFILPHSHTDIGYTEIQTAIEKKQVNNLVQGIDFARKTANYPEGARFVWNVEVAWAADLYLHRLNEQQRADFFDAIKKGQVVLNGMYLNELTGLCRPEELIRLFRYSTELASQCGVTIDSAMTSDVPGQTWGTVPAMNQAGIKYFSTAPNYFDRIGTILREWENKPFYWMGPDGKSKVLVWIPFWGYAMSHRYGQLTDQFVEDFYRGLEQRKYPYDIAYVRWSGHGDNAVPDTEICEFVKDWNTKYAWPKFIISGTSQAFRAFEQKYGDKLPLVRGDWTPYWEDGAGSSASETALNRATSDRIAQAETVYAMLKPTAYPATAFEDAWRNTLLYSEHTWGADCSISEPERQKTKEQWDIKQGYALAADKQSRQLLQQSLSGTAEGNAGIDIVNTLSWSRTEVVVLPPELSKTGEQVVDGDGKVVPSQRLISGELAFLASEVPPFAAKRYQVTTVPGVQKGAPRRHTIAKAEGATLDNGQVHVCLDEKTGGITELTLKGVDGNFVDTTGGETLNDYLYLQGDKLPDLKRNGPVSIRVGEKGPLVASLIVESEAPGCKTLRREIRLVAGMDHVEIINTVDKARLLARDYHANEGKESVNFGFPFNVPDGEVLLDVPFGGVRPELDQMPSACKNWFSVGRWAEVANRDRGITWVTLDAPLVQVGGITATLLNSQFNPDVWRKKVDKTQKLYCWAMNNHWGTNYRAYQDGPTVFRFVLRPHRHSTPDAATRFATGFSQPLQVTSARTDIPRQSMLKVDGTGVVVTAMKPSDDGKAIIVRLFGASGETTNTKLSWAQPHQMWFSDTSEKALQRVNGKITVPAWGVVTVRAELEK